MPMMRRGPIDRYPAEWVLRQANAHEAGGSIEFHTARPATFYLDGGRIYAAELGVDLVEGGLGQAAIPDEAEARRQVISMLTAVIDADGGWYYHDPLGQHPGRGSWTWETATLLMETRAKAHEDHTLAAWADRRVRLHETPAASITLGPDAWAIVVSLSEEAATNELRTRLGWNPSRLLAALTEIEQHGVLGPPPAWRQQVTMPPTYEATRSAQGPVPVLARRPQPAARPLGLRKTDVATATPSASASPPPSAPTTPDVRSELRSRRRRKLPGRRSTGD